MCRPQPSVLRIFTWFSPDMLQKYEPWGHVVHAGVACGCRSSDRMGAYVHAIASGHIGPSTYGDTVARCNTVIDWDRTGVFLDGVTLQTSQDCAGSAPTVSVPAALRISADLPPGRGFSRQCLSGSASQSHDLMTLAGLSQPSSSDSGDVLQGETIIDAPALHRWLGFLWCTLAPFRSYPAGAYGRLLLATHK